MADAIGKVHRRSDVVDEFAVVLQGDVQVGPTECEPGDGLADVAHLRGRRFHELLTHRHTIEEMPNLDPRSRRPVP